MVKIYTLSNGFQVLLCPNNTYQTTTAHIALKAGSRVEERGKEGLAHLVEHMLFRSSKDFPDGQLDLELAKLGGVNNGGTKKEYVYYYISSLPEDLEFSLYLLSQIVFSPLFTESTFALEKQIVMEENAGHSEEYLNSLYQFLWPNAYSFTHPIGGNSQTIEALELSDVENFLNTFYIPANAVLTVVGNFDEETITKTIKKHFGQLKKKDNQSDDYFQKPLFTPKQDLFLIEKNNTESTFCALAFVNDLTLTSPERIPARILINILNDRLAKSIRVKEGLSYSIEAQSIVNSDSGLFVIQGVFSRKNFYLVLPYVLLELMKLRKEGISNEELEIAKAKEKMTELLLSETPQGYASWIGVEKLLAGKFVSREETVKTIQNITVEDIKILATKSFVRTNLGIYIAGPVEDDVINLFRDFVQAL